MKKRNRFLSAIALLIAGIGVFEGCQSAKNSTATKLLKFNLENNKGYDYELTMSMDQEIMGKPLKMDMVTYYSMDVTGGENETKNIVTAIDRFKMKTGVAGFNIDVDTDNPATAGDTDNPLGMLNKVFGAIKGQRFSMQVSPEGKIIDVKGFDGIGSRIADSLGLENEQKQMMKQQFDSQFNEEQLKQSLGRFWYIFPNKEIKVGDTWTKNFEMGGKMGGKYISDYKVTDIEGDMVTLDEHTKIESNGGDKNISGTVTGTMVVDSRTGLIVTADQDMNIKASDSGQTAEMKVKSKLKGKARE